MGKQRPLIGAIRSVLSNRVGTEGIQKEREFLKSVEFTLSDLNMWDGKNLVFFSGRFYSSFRSKFIVVKDIEQQINNLDESIMLLLSKQVI